MLGKTHTNESLALISKPGKLNSMFGKKHSEMTKASMSEKKNKYPLGVGLYDLDGNLILTFKKLKNGLINVLLILKLISSSGLIFLTLLS